MINISVFDAEILPIKDRARELKALLDTASRKRDPGNFIWEQAASEHLREFLRVVDKIERIVEIHAATAIHGDRASLQPQGIRAMIRALIPDVDGSGSILRSQKTFDVCIRTAAEYTLSESASDSGWTQKADESGLGLQTSPTEKWESADISSVYNPGNYPSGWPSIAEAAAIRLSRAADFSAWKWQYSRGLKP